MGLSQQRHHLLIFAALTVASILIFQISVIFFLFTIPIFIINRSYGMQYLLMASFFITLVIVIQTLIRASGIEEKALRQFLIIAELAYPLTIIGGVVAVSYYYKIRTLYIFLSATAGFAICSILVIYYYSGNEEIVSLLKDQIVYVADLFTKVVESSDSYESTILIKELQPDSVVQATSKLIFRNYLFAYFIMLTGSWYFAEVFFTRWHRRQKFMLVDFIVPENLIWFLIVSLLCILADVFLKITWIGYLMWNTSLIMLFIYGLHGIGLIEYFLDRYKVSKSARRFIIIASIVVLLLPWINLVILVGIPVLGVSELWIKYRTSER